jgi:hypothetical protein
VTTFYGAINFGNFLIIDRIIFSPETDGGRMKLLKNTACFLFLILCVCGVSHAAIVQTTPATVTYTADNMVNAWWLIGPSQAPQLLPMGPNSANWQQADSHQLSLIPNQNYQIIWEVKNLWSQQFPPGSNNPAGFLAQIAFGGQPAILSSGSWEVAPYTYSGAPFNSLSWTSATPFGANSAGTIWSSANQGSIAGIDGNAQWIWSSGNIWDQHIFVRTNFQAPVPIPGAAWLLGTGLIGLATIRRRRQK